MEEIIYPINLDLRTNTHKVLVMKEGDYNSRVIEATITNNGKPFNIDNCTVDIKWRKPDSHIVYSEVNKLNSSTIRVVCTEQMLCVSGISVAEIVITDSNSVVSTLTFNISVNETVASDFDIESSDEFSSLRQMKEHIVNNDIHIPEGGVAGQAVVKDENGNVTWGEVSGGSSGDYLEKENPSGKGSFSMNRKAGSTVGDYSVATGNNCEAGKYCSYAEGNYTVSNGGYGSHAEGSTTTASGVSSHAEGDGSTASGSCSHAEGSTTTASGYASHAEGFYTTASGEYQHVHGKYNIEDTENKYAHIVGGGDYDNKKNIHTLDWNGNAEFAGDVTNGNGVSLSNLGKLENLSTNFKENLVGAVNEVFQSVSNGKSLIASAITDMGVFTESDAKFEIMARNIKKIPKGSDYIMVTEMAIDSHIDYVTVVKEEE